jgi:hypothetical protein
MTPTAPELLIGNFMALIEPPPPESVGDFMAGKIAVTGMISLLIAQEMEKGVAVRVAENRAIRALFNEAAAGGWAPDLSVSLKALARGEDEDLTLTALDRDNAALRLALIALQTAVEDAAGAAGRARQKRIIRLLREGSDARRLDLPPMPAS